MLTNDPETFINNSLSNIYTIELYYRTREFSDEHILKSHFIQ